MSIANPYLVPGAWGQVTIGGSVLPGILTAITIGPRKFAFTKQKGFGQTEVTIYSTTEAIDGIRVDHFLRPNNGASRGDFESLRDGFMPLLIPGWPSRIVGKPKSFPFVHPIAQWVGLKRAHLTEVHAPGIVTPGDPSYWYTLVFQEDIPQQRVPVGPPEPAQINGPPVPKDAQEATLLALFANWKGVPVQSLPAATATGSAQ